MRVLHNDMIAAGIKGNFRTTLSPVMWFTKSLEYHVYRRGKGWRKLRRYIRRGKLKVHAGE